MHHGIMALPIAFGNLWLSNTQEPILNTWINTTSEESFDIQSEQYCDECLTLIKQGIFSSSHCTQVKAKCFSRGSFHSVTQGDSAPNKYRHTIHLLSSIIEITWIPWFNEKKSESFLLPVGSREIEFGSNERVSKWVISLAVEEMIS